MVPLPALNYKVDAMDFTLIGEGGLPRPPTERERTLLSHLFPSQFGFCIDGPFLVVYVSELPARPWPRLVAGLPLYLATTAFESPLPVGGLGIVRWSVLDDLDATNTSSQALYQAVIDFFESKGVQIQEIQWMFGCWRIVVPEGTGISSLPGRICRIAAFYFSKGYRHNIPPVELALRNKQPTKDNPDDSPYSIIRPGVTVASKEFLTTAGIFVEDAHKTIFLTVASHGFPTANSAVFHPQTNGRHIGDVSKRIEDSGISLVKLKEDVKFENHSFQSDIEPHGVMLKSIKDPFAVRRFETISMDTPFSGPVDGQFLTVNMVSFPEKNCKARRWVKQGWVWFGQDPKDIPPAGSCGSAIWDSEGNIICFFRYLSDDSIGIGVAAYELLEEGYSLCRTDKARLSF
ncbi:hypothetical protein McanMca71_001413 [Microsporum canis]|uniref:Uncharacterized protein n=1 Tax=Arthroderma otae (strain ATCC MYA-4605 / CBS 113480) TaxID=554155 RepID=C5FU42_ARTOC|nr:conserved hypothetical protein [Microsporum canis CBS 113480]EEQ33426.1 conserved hypothetical protein [Microsporum canis CBS 113480]